MNVTNEKMQDKILKYHQLVRDGKDTTAIKAEIDAYTNQYIDDTNRAINQIVQEKKDIKTEIDRKKPLRVSIRKEYARLIELYRKTLDISKELSDYKKILREMK
jgi:predicted secreted protein